MKRRSALWLLPVFLFVCSAVPALAGEQEDFNAIYADWQKDDQVTPCHWSKAQLQNADRLAEGSPDSQYATGFQDEVRREIARWNAGGCAGVSPASARNASPLRGLKIVGVRGRGGASREVVRIRNTTAKRVSLKGATLRGRGGKRAKFPARFRLAGRRTAVVVVGCGGRSRAWFKGTKVWLCRRTALFNDRGDAARLADAKGVFVSQRSYGTASTLINY